MSKFSFFKRNRKSAAATGGEPNHPTTGGGSIEMTCHEHGGWAVFNRGDNYTDGDGRSAIEYICSVDGHRVWSTEDGPDEEFHPGT